MTCREKWEMDHPRGEFLPQHSCPWQYKYLDPPEYCGELRSDTCERCWDREIPEEPKKEKTMIESIEHTCADCVHQDVCKHMNEFLAAKQAIVDTYVVIGDKTHVKMLDIPCIKAVGLQCKFYRKDVKTI